MNKKLKVCDFNHLILYAKHWYKHTDFVADVRKILAERCALDPQHMSPSDIWMLIYHAAEMYLKEYDFNDVFTSMFSTSIYDDLKGGLPFKWEGKTDWTRPARMIISKLSIVETTNLNLGRPDPTILPVIDNCDERWEEMNKP